MRTARASGIVERGQHPLSVADQMEEDALTVVADPTEPDQVRPVQRDREDTGGGIVPVTVVGQDHVEMEHSVLGRTCHVLVQACREGDGTGREELAATSSTSGQPRR